MSGTRSVDFYFDVVSPYTYLAVTQLKGISERTGASFRWLPMLLGGVFKSAGGGSPMDVPLKGRYMFRDLAEWAHFYGVTLHLPKAFPFRSMPLQRGLIALPEERREILARAFFKAIWVDARDVTSPEAVSAICAEAGYDGESFLASNGDPSVKAALKDATDEAVKRGVFGAPSFIVDERMYWGNDRLVLLERYLAS